MHISEDPRRPVAAGTRKRSTAALLSVAAALALTLISRASVAEQMTVVTSDAASRSAFVTNKGIQWYSNLADAEGQAKREGKLVLWIHMLGTMDGAT